MSRDTSIFALRLLGRRSSPWTAMAVSLLISVAAGICEEVAFRGFVYNAIWQTSGETAALLLSSLAFGLAHFPVFGASTFLELLFGLVFAMSYKLSGFNLFVPIVVHVVYDFVVLFVTWLGSTAEFKRRIDEMEWDILTVPADTPLPPQIDILARLVMFACHPSIHPSSLVDAMLLFLVISRHSSHSHRLSYLPHSH